MLKKVAGILAGPIGWVITGALVSINLAGPAYRVIVPACVLIATLRLKLKAEQEAKREANKKMWYLAITFLVGLAILAVFFIKREHQSSNDPSNSPKSGVKKLKNPSHKNYKKNNNNHPQAQNQQGSKRLKSVKESKIPF